MNVNKMGTRIGLVKLQGETVALNGGERDFVVRSENYKRGAAPPRRRAALKLVMTLIILSF